jgi:deoxycytidylate deaminase
MAAGTERGVAVTDGLTRWVVVTPCPQCDKDMVNYYCPYCFYDEGKEVWQLSDAQKAAHSRFSAGADEVGSSE